MTASRLPGEDGGERRERGPSAVIALLLYNHADTLPEALDSLRHQDRGDFAVLMVDDGSSDTTPEICKAVASVDARFIYLSDGIRRGYVGNARHALSEAQRRFPSAAFFAWGSDHDLYHPRWLSSLVSALEDSPDASLAWPECLRIDGEGRVLPRVVHRFETAGIADPSRRFAMTLKANLTGETQIGNMIYGLFRRRFLDAGATMPAVLLPDRALILDAAIDGPCVQVEQPLWYRRYEGLGSHARQRRASFPNGVPIVAYLPVWLQHSGYFLRRRGPRVAFTYAIAAVRWQLYHRARLGVPRAVRRLRYAVAKPFVMGVHRGRKRVRSLIGRGLRIAGLRR